MNIRRARPGSGLLPCLSLLMLCAAPAGAAPVEFPPLQTPATKEHHVGKVIWAELITPDLAAARQFYGGLFGWTFSEMRAGEARYALASSDGRPVAGLLEKTISAGEHKQPSWLTFIAVRDVDAAKRTVLARGGKVLAEPATYRARGRQAVFADPDGAVFAVLASGSGDPGDFLAEPGEWIWSSVLAQDPDAVAKFYKDVFGYDVFDLPSQDELKHVVLSTEDYARAGVNSLPKDARHRHPHWLNFIRVADTDATAAKAVSLGGKILVEPHPDRHGGKIALIADPSGAPFGLMEWTVSDSKVEPK